MLVDAAPRILGEFPEQLSAYAKATLEELGVEVMLNTPCECIDARGITLKGERIETANICWCAGTKAEPAADWVDAAKAKNGGVEVTSDCSIANHPEIFAIGDVSSYRTKDGKTLPALAPVAKQQGGYVAKVIASRLGVRKHPGPFKYTNLGTMAVIGPLARDRAPVRPEAEGAARLARVVAGPPAAADRLPQPPSWSSRTGRGPSSPTGAARASSSARCTRWSRTSTWQAPERHAAQAAPGGVNVIAFDSRFSATWRLREKMSRRSQVE